MGGTETLHLMPNDLPQATGHSQTGRSALSLSFQKAPASHAPCQGPCFSTPALSLRVSLHKAQHSCLCPYRVSPLAVACPRLPRCFSTLPAPGTLCLCHAQCRADQLLLPPLPGTAPQHAEVQAHLSGPFEMFELEGIGDHPFGNFLLLSVHVLLPS